MWKHARQLSSDDHARERARDFIRERRGSPRQKAGYATGSSGRQRLPLHVAMPSVRVIGNRALHGDEDVHREWPRSDRESLVPGSPGMRHQTARSVASQGEGARSPIGAVHHRAERTTGSSWTIGAVALGLLLWAAGPVAATGLAGAPAAELGHRPGTCWEQASLKYGVNPRLLVAVAGVESGLRPQTLHRNRDGSTDIGIMQINSGWLPTLARFGIDLPALLDPCMNVHVGAWILAQNMRRLGNSWEAVGAYNSSSAQGRAKYSAKVQQAIRRLGAAAEHWGAGRTTAPPITPAGPCGSGPGRGAKAGQRNRSPTGTATCGRPLGETTSVSAGSNFR